MRETAHMRCFPHCSAVGHREKGFCGSPVLVRVEAPGAMMGAEMFSSMIIIGGIRSVQEKPWCAVGETIQEADLSALEEANELIRGRMAGDRLPAGTFEISPGKRKGWAYGWNANAFRKKIKHRFWVLCFLPIQGPGSEAGGLSCVGSSSSSEFEVHSSKQRVKTGDMKCNASMSSPSVDIHSSKRASADSNDGMKLSKRPRYLPSGATSNPQEYDTTAQIMQQGASFDVLKHRSAEPQLLAQQLQLQQLSMLRQTQQLDSQLSQLVQLQPSGQQQAGSLQLQLLLERQIAEVEQQLAGGLGTVQLAVAASVCPLGHAM